MLPIQWNISPIVVELCFQTPRVMLLESQSIAFRVSEHSFPRLGAMLLESESNAFRVQGLCFSCLGVMLFDVACIFRLAKVVLLQYFFDFYF